MSLRQLKCAAQPTSTAAFCDWIIESRRGPVCLISAACFMSFIVGLGAIGVWGIREKRLAACVADIVYGHNWLVPNLCGRPRLEKPPLPYWIIASFSTLTGQLNEWVLRLPGVVAGLVILSVVYRLAAEVGER